MEQVKEYYAFISYKREDEKWAKWLQYKLEHYRFPTNLNGRTNLPKNIRPTFRDVTDLNPGLLAEEINNALCNSEWLIVICSPRSAKSPWVCKEAQTFIDLGRADHIIPFVIEGNPFSKDAATECYPEALLNLTGSNELLAANINEMGRDAAVVKVVARMFGLKFDTLWQRYEKDKNRKRFFYVIVLILLLFLSAVIIGYITNQNRQLKVANETILAEKERADTERDRVQKTQKSLSIAYDSIKVSNKLILETQDSLRNTNNALSKAYADLLIANTNLENEKSIVVEREKKIIEKSASVLITSANEQFANEDFLSASMTLSKVIELIKGNNISDKEVLINYERAVRKLESKWEEPGIQLVNSVICPNTIYGGFKNDNEIYIPDFNNKMKAWRFYYHNDKVKSLYNVFNQFSKAVYEDLRYCKHGKYLKHDSELLEVIDNYNDKCIGEPLNIGRSWYNVHFSLSSNDGWLYVAKDSSLISYNYLSGHTDTIIKIKQPITNFVESPSNSNLITLVTSNDSCVMLVNKAKKKIIYTRKFDSRISTASYHPSGEYISIVGDEINIVNWCLSPIFQYKRENPLNLFCSSFNKTGSLLYTYSSNYDYVHSVWAIGYAPYDYSLLSNDGRYGVLYENKRYEIYDYKHSVTGKNSIPNDNYRILAFGNEGPSLLVATISASSKKYSFLTWNFINGGITEFPKLSLDKIDNGYLMEHLNKFFVISDEKLYAFDMKNNTIHQPIDMGVRKIRYSRTNNTIIVLKADGGLIRLSQDLVQIPDTFLNSVSKVKDFDIDEKGNLYIVDADGYLYLIEPVSHCKKYIGVVDNAKEISVDPQGQYVLTHYFTYPKYEISFDKPYGYNILSDTKIWDIDRQEIIEDISSYKLTTAKLIRNFKGSLMIDADHFLIPIHTMNFLENRIVKRHTIN